MTAKQDAHARMIADADDVEFETGLSPERTDELKAALDASAVTAGGSMAVAEPVTTDDAVTAGAAWSGVIAQEGVDTGDGRRIEKDALGWRELPLTLMSQLVTPEFGGHTDAMVAGRIDSIERAGANIEAGGVFDTGEHGATTERLVREQVLRGVSIDLAVNEAEVIPAEDVDDPMEAWFLGTLVVLDGTILGATVVPFPAFENASIAITAGAAMRLSNARRDADGRMVVSFFMPFTPGFATPPPPPPPEKPAGDPQAALEDAMGAAEDAISKLRDAVDGMSE